MKRFAAHKTALLLKMIPTSKLLLGLLVLAASSAEAFHPRSIDAVEFARASVVGRKREASDVDADSLLGADTPEEYSSPVSSRRRNEKEVEEGSVNKDLEDSDVGGGRGFPSGPHMQSLPMPPLFYGHH